jgi:hypothetical protein
MRLALSACLCFSLVSVAPAAALPKQEWKAVSCILERTRDQGNPEVAVDYALDDCPTEGFSQADQGAGCPPPDERLSNEMTGQPDTCVDARMAAIKPNIVLRVPAIRLVGGEV